MSSEEVEKRLRTLEDIEEIKQLQARYVDCLITIEWDELFKCFTDDATVDLHSGLARGKAEIIKLFTEKIAITHVGTEGLYVVHPIITVDGDKAKASWLLYTHFSQPHKIQVDPAKSDDMADAPDWMQGYYKMEYIRVDGKWKIKLLRWRRRLRSPRLPSD